MDGPASSGAAAGIALDFNGAHKPLTQQQSAFDKVEGDLSNNIVTYS
jgi:hypothetical protein